MELLREEQVQVASAELEAQKHNAMIKERYRRLQNALADQFAAVENAVHAETPVKEEGVSYINPSEVNTAVLEQEPTVTEYISPMASALFTTEKFERLTVEEPVRQVAPTPIAQAVVSTQAQYSLSPLAKVVMAVFTAVVVIMLALIGMNTQTIQRKSLRLKNLEEKKQELIERNEEVQRYIEELQTEESIIKRATEAGLLN
jgi:cell division protein FtsL